MSKTFSPVDFSPRHIGPTQADIKHMLDVIGVASIDELISKTIPSSIFMDGTLKLPDARSEADTLKYMWDVLSQNEPWQSHIGTGYYNCITPSVIRRNILENPGWYTQYTPYQAEIAQGRLEALLNFQTMIADLTGLPIANASMLDEATAAAEAISMSIRTNRKNKSRRVWVESTCHPQTIGVVQTRADYLEIEVVVSDEFPGGDNWAAALVQYPATSGTIGNYRELAEQVHAIGAHLIVATDLLALTLIEEPGAFGADVAVGSAQRFGVSLGYGGPHAGFMSATEEFTRQLPGRIVGQSKDKTGKPALRLAMQTREQHIRRDRATSNICTAQVLLAVMSGMYAVYHGPEGLKAIALRVHDAAKVVKNALLERGFEAADGPFFDTLRFSAGDESSDLLLAAANAKVNLRRYDNGDFGISVDEATNDAALENLLSVILGTKIDDKHWVALTDIDEPMINNRSSDFLTHPVFHSYRSESGFLRYVHALQARDLSLTSSMIPLGSCTMKLNATTEMIPVTWDCVAGIHPFAPTGQTQGYQALFTELESMLAEITGFDNVSLQPNAGSQGEYAGMLAIRGYHDEHGDSAREICLIPESAHGTNPASAVMAGMKVVGVKCDERGNVDVEDLRLKAEKHADTLAAIMVTYPSTHGVFEREINTICSIVHEFGGQVYLDGANMNAQVGICRPGDYGADVCHLNLHKTFCIPHGGGGPGMGPIGVKAHLEPFLPSHPVVPIRDEKVGAVSAAPWGSASILPISWAYILMLGAEGLRSATEAAILNANYMAKRLESHYDILYRGADGFNAHEFIIDLRPFKKDTDIEVMDVAKRLMDYGFHAPTVSFPVAGTMMIEPTESEPLDELDRFCDAMIAIRGEIEKVTNGEWPKENNPVTNAPHTAAHVTADAWDHPYSRQTAAFPNETINKFWPFVARIDDAFGDRNLVCTCPPVSAFAED